jgi:hypothetical protein
MTARRLSKIAHGNSVNVMRIADELLTRLLTPDVGRERSEFSSALAATRRRRPVRRLSDSRDASLVAGKGSRREVAVILNRVPPGLDAAHVGFVFIDVMGNGH